MAIKVFKGSFVRYVIYLSFTLLVYIPYSEKFIKTKYNLKLSSFVELAAFKVSIAGLASGYHVG